MSLDMEKILMDNPDYEYFLVALDYEIKNNWHKKAYLFAKKAGMSQGNISKIANKKIYAPYETQLKIIKASKDIKDYESFILFGKKIKTYKDSNDNVSISGISLRGMMRNHSHSFKDEGHVQIDITTERHRQVIERFQQRELALQINEELADLEKLDKDKLKSVLNYIQYQKKITEEELQKKRPASNEE